MKKNMILKSMRFVAFSVGFVGCMALHAVVAEPGVAPEATPSASIMSQNQDVKTPDVKTPEVVEPTTPREPKAIIDESVKQDIPTVVAPTSLDADPANVAPANAVPVDAVPANAVPANAVPVDEAKVTPVEPVVVSTEKKDDAPALETTAQVEVPVTSASPVSANAQEEADFEMPSDEEIEQMFAQILEAVKQEKNEQEATTPQPAPTPSDK